MTLVGGDYEVAPGIRMRRAPGHNRDMMVVTAESGGEMAAFDLYPLQAIETKLHWLTAAAESGWLCAFAHDAKTDFARIAKHPKTGFALAR
jgi:hypothetical protein